jgi:hypothetical protein
MTTEKLDWLAPLSRWESWTVVAGNLLPLLGIFYLGWDAATLVILYWAETAIVGLWLVVRLALATPAELTPVTPLVGGKPAEVGGLGLGLFVLVHAGFFMGIHMFMLSGIAPGEWTRHLASPAAFILGFIVPTGLWMPLAGLFVVRGVTTWHDIRAARPVTHLIAGFYARIVVMQFVILLGGMVALLAGSPLVLLVLIVLLKTAFELYWERLGAWLEAVFSSQKPRG